MKINKKFFFALLTFGLVLITMLWLARGDGNRSQIHSSEHVVPPNLAEVGASVNPSEVTERVSDQDRSLAKNVEGGPLMVMLNTSLSARALHDELMKRIDGGDLEAFAALDELQSRCGAFSSSQGRQYAEQDVAISKSDNEFEDRRVALNELTAFCDRPYAPGEIKAEMKFIEDAMRAAAAKGDEVAKIWLAVHMGETVDGALLLRHVSSRDPWVAEMALLGFSNANDPRSRAVREQVFSDWRGSSAAAEIETIVQAAARWRACDLGRPCGPGGYYQHYQCLYGGGYCEPGLGVKDYIRRQLSGRQYEAMLRYIESLDALAKSTL